MLDYTDEEVVAIRTVLKQRYKQEIETFLADCEVQADPAKDDLIERPAIFWQAHNCNFVVVKMAEDRFEGHYFYRPDEHIASSQQTYTNAVNCTIALLQSQADDVGRSQGYESGKTAADFKHHEPKLEKLN